MKKLLFFFTLLISIVNVRAANNLHTFKVSNAAYAELTGDVDITAAVMAHDSFIITALNGQTIMLYGQPLVLNGTDKYFQVNRDARVWVVRDTALSLFDALETTKLDTIDNTSKISYKIDGSGNNIIIKLQWKNFKVDHGPSGNYINVQTWIYLGTGIIEYRYGARSANNASGYNTTLTGLYIGIYYSNFSFSKIYEKIQVTGTQPNITIDSVLNLNVPFVEGAPADGTMYVFTPKQGPATVNAIKGKTGFVVFPNPAVKEVLLQCSALPYDMPVYLFDIGGKLVKQLSLGKGREQLIIPVTDIPAGNYFIRLGENGDMQKLSIAGM